VGVTFAKNPHHKPSSNILLWISASRSKSIPRAVTKLCPLKSIVNHQIPSLVTISLPIEKSTAAVAQKVFAVFTNLSFMPFRI